MGLPDPKYGHFLGSIEDFVTGEKTGELQDLVENVKGLWRVPTHYCPFILEKNVSMNKALH